MRRLFCVLLGHKYRIVQKFSKDSRRVVCDRCCGDWGMNDRVQMIIPWTVELEEMYRMFGHNILKP